MAAAAAARRPVTRMRSLLLPFVLAASIAQGAGRELAPREFGPTPYPATRATIAFAGGTFLTVWNESRGLLGSHVAGALSDATGRPLGPSFTIVRQSPRWMQLVSTGDAFVLFQDMGPALEMTEIDLSGRVTRTRRIAMPELISNVAWNGTHFLAISQNTSITSDAQGILISRDGAIVRRRIAIAGLLGWPQEILVDGGDFVVLTAGRDGLFADRITSEGAVTRTLIEESRGFVPSYYGPVRAVGTIDDGRLLLLWVSAEGPMGYEVRTAVLHPGGQRGIVHRLATTPQGTLPIPLAAMRTENGYVVAYSQPQYSEFGEQLQPMTAVALDETGAPVSTSGPVFLGGGIAVAAEGAGVIAVAYTPSPAGHQGVLHRVIDAGGAIGEPHHVSIARSRQLQPILGAGQFAAAFTEISGTARVRTAAIDAGGEPRRNQFIADKAAVVGKDLVWNGSAYLAVMQQEQTLLAQRLTADGEPLGPPAVLAADDEYPSDIRAAVVWSVDRWVVVWVARDGEEAFFAAVSPAGIVADQRELTPANPERYFVDVALAADGPRILVAWIEADVNEIYFVNRTAFARRFRRDGREIDVAPVRVAGDASYLSATAGDHFIVVTDTPKQTLMTKLDADGPALTALATRSLPPGISDVAWDGDEYVVASRHLPDWPRHLVVSRFDGRLEPSRPARGVIVLRPDEYAQPSVATVAGEAVVAIQEADAENGARAVVYRESAMSSLPWPPPRHRAVRH
jgi:hypothetical protein